MSIDVREAVFSTYPYTLLFSNDSRELYCISSYPYPKLYVWRMEPEWIKLAKMGAQP